MSDLKDRMGQIIKNDRLETRELIDPAVEKIEKMWSELVIQAYQDLTEVTFPLWMFSVGTSGNSEDRLNRGYFHYLKLKDLT